MTLTIGIAGCGVAGLACASLLARESHRVVVFDRMETPQPLGSGLILQPAGLVVLDEIGAGARIRSQGAKIERLFGKVQPSGRVVLDVRYAARGRNSACGVAVHRGLLFDALLEAAREAGVEIETGREVVSASDGRVGFKDGRTSAVFDLVIDALGVRSPLSRPEGLAPLPFGALWASLDFTGPFDAQALEQRYRQARKMVGVLPIGLMPSGSAQTCAFFWSLKHTDFQAWRAAPIDQWKDEVRTLWPETAPLLDQIGRHEDLVFASYAHGTLASPVGSKLVHVGDSWHCASPQLGQGANMALLDALALARAIGSRGSVEEALAAYQQARALHIRLYQAITWAFTPAYQSDSATLAFLRDFLLAPVSRVWPLPPLLAGLVAGAIGSPLTAIEGISDGAPQALSSAPAGD